MARIKKQKRHLYASGWMPAARNSWRTEHAGPHALFDQALSISERSTPQLPPAVVRPRMTRLVRWSKWPSKPDWCPTGARTLVDQRWLAEPGLSKGQTLGDIARQVLGLGELDSVWLEPFICGFTGCEGSRSRWARIAAMRASGARLSVLKRAGLMPRGFTRHMLEQMDGSYRSLTRAYRSAIVYGLGGGDGLEQALWHTRLSSLQMDEDRWFRFVAWVIHHGIDAADVRRWVDYLTVHLVDVDTIKPSGLWREVDRWGVKHVDPTRMGRVKFAPAGFGGHPPLNDNVAMTGWSFHELLSIAALVDEGTFMGHCVGSYARHVRRGVSSIWSVRRMTVPMLTVEVKPGSRQVCQVRGFANRSATVSERRVIQAWALANDLHFRP